MISASLLMTSKVFPGLEDGRNKGSISVPKPEIVVGNEGRVGQ